MIRAGLPMPAFHRLAFAVQAAAHRWTRSVERVRRGMNDWLTASMPHPLQTIRNHRVEAEIQRSARLLADVELQFDELVDLLCWTAKDGCNARADKRYADVRSWFLDRYQAFGPGFRHFLSHGSGVDTATRTSSSDVLESLFLPADVADNIHSATVIDRITSARAALEAFRAHVDDTEH